MILSLLRVIDNPSQDIPLLAVLMSPLYGFTADDAARLRLESRDVPVYVSLLRAAETDPPLPAGCPGGGPVPGGGGHNALGRLSQLPVQQDGLSRYGPGTLR